MYNLEFLRMINNGYDPLLILGKGGLGYHYDKPMVGYGLTPQQKKLVEGLTPEQAKELSQALGFEYEPEVNEEEAIKKVINELNEVMDEQLPTDPDDALSIMQSIKINDIEQRSILDDAAKIIDDKNFRYWGLDDNYKQVKQFFEREKKDINKDTKLSDEEKEEKLMEIEDKQKAVDGLRERYQQNEELTKALLFELTKNPHVSKQNVNFFLSKLKDADDIVRDVVKLRYPTSIEGKIDAAIDKALAPGSEVMKEFEKEKEAAKKYGTEIKEPGIGIGLEYALTNNPDLMEELTGEKHTNLLNTKDAYKHLGDKAKYFVADAVDDNTMWEFKNYSSGGTDSKTRKRYEAIDVEKVGHAPLTTTKFLGNYDFVPYFIEDNGKYKLYNVWNTKKGQWAETNQKLRDYKALWSTKDGFWSYDIANDPDMKYDTSWFQQQTKYKINKNIPDIGMVGTKPLLKILPPKYGITQVLGKDNYLIPKDKLKFLKPKMNF